MAPRSDSRRSFRWSDGLDYVRSGVGVAVRSSAVPMALGLRWARRSEANHADVPAPEWGLRLFSKAMLDDLFLASEVASATVVSLGHGRRLIREITDSVELYERNGWLEDPASYHDTPSAPRSVRRLHATSNVGIYCHVQFESGYAPHPGEPGRERWLAQAPNRVAHAWVLEHRGEPRPWVVCVPGYRMGMPAVDFGAFRARWLHHQQGVNVAIPVMPLHGPRRAGRRGGDGFLSGDFVDTIHAQAQAVWDTRRLIRWIRATGAPRVAVHGVSLGGCTTALVAALESELDCVILGVPAADFLALARQHVPALALDLVERLQFPMGDLECLLRVVSPLAMPPRVAHDRRFIYAGTADRLTIPAQARALWRHWGEPRLEWYQGSHVSFLWEAKVTALIREALIAGEVLAELR